MGRRAGKHHYLIGEDAGDAESLDLDSRLKRLLSKKMHGISFSAYVKGQKPGDELTREQIEHRMTFIAPRFNWIRSFSTTQGNELIPQVAKSMGLATLVGAWFGEDAQKNRSEIE